MDVLLPTQMATGLGQPQQRAPDADRVLKKKVVLLGATGVGKSSLVLRYMENRFVASQHSTVGGAQFFTKKERVRGRATVQMNIWDTAGQERFHSLANLYYRGANAAIIVYSVGSDASFVDAVQWEKTLAENDLRDIVVAFVGNKSDLDLQDHAVMARNVRRMAARENFIFVETSAKLGTNVDQLFAKVASRLVDAEDDLLDMPPAYEGREPPLPGRNIALGNGGEREMRNGVQDNTCCTW